MASFVSSLSAKVHSSPPTIDNISSLFQDFYTRAESLIGTHISALASRINRDTSPRPPPKGSRAGFQQKKGTRDGQNDPEKDASGRQMLTASEVAEKRKARKFLSQKHVALEEAVERRACESIYDKIFQHKTTLDDVRDEKLRSKTGALLLVGINLKDLGIDIDITAIDHERQKEADDHISVARDCLAKMNDEKYPLGKLQHLAAAHKAIVDALTKLLPSSSSADEILPALIYSLVTCPPEGINVISNLLFIQRFRSSSKVYGETAYCLTNLEAAVSFLENVDLSDLRADEGQDGRPKSASNNLAPSTERPTSRDAPTPSLSSVSVSPEFLKPASGESASASLARPRSSSLRQRPLSNLLQPPSKVLGAANDAVRSTADQSLKNIGATLDSSFNFFFGRLKELQSNQVPVTEGGIPVLPKTLAEARRLVAAQQGTPEGRYPGQGDSLPKQHSSVDHVTSTHSSFVQDTPKDAASGGKTPRDRSADSGRTQNSARKPATQASPKNEHTHTPGSSQATPQNPSTPTPLESMKNFGTSLNPLSHIPGMMKNFARPAGASSPAPSEKAKASPTQAASTPNPPSPPSNIDPPVQRFLEAQHVNDLTIGDVSALLDDYKRLAAVLFKQAGDSS